MLYVLQTFWPWFLAALVLGLIVGWRTWSDAKHGNVFASWFGWATATFAVSIVIALSCLFAGRAGLWLETALFSTTAYVIGCLIGGMLKALFAVDGSVRQSAQKPAVSMPSRPVPASSRPPVTETPPPRPLPVTAAPLPAPAPRLPDQDEHEGLRPAGFASARGGIIDDLKLISGVGHQNEARLHGLGIWHFDQIADWTHDNVVWVGSYLAFPGRIEREHWVQQAKDLAAGKTTPFAERVKAGLVKTSLDDGTRGQNNIDTVKK